MTATINYRDGMWTVSANGLGAEMGFWTLAAARSFATRNRLTVKLTNQAIVASVR